MTDTPAPDTPAPQNDSTSDAQTLGSAQSKQDSQLRSLATALAAPQAVYATVVKGTVVSTAMAAAPPTISINLSGDTSTTISNVRCIDSYSPVVGDTVLLVKQGSDLFALGQMNDTGSGPSNGWVTPTLGSGFTQNGNAEGNLQYRVVVDNGDLKLQFRGSVAVSGSPTTVFTLDANSRPSAKRTVVCAREWASGTGNTVVSVDINTSGDVALQGVTVGVAAVGTTSGTYSGTTGSTAPGTDVQAHHRHFHSGAFDPSVSDFTDYNGDHSHTVNSHSHSTPSHSHSIPVSNIVWPLWVSFHGVEVFL